MDTNNEAVFGVSIGIGIGIGVGLLMNAIIVLKKDK